MLIVMFLFSDVHKKLLAVAIKAANRPLQPWLKAINNHLYWSCENSGGDPEVNMNLIYKKINMRSSKMKEYLYSYIHNCFYVADLCTAVEIIDAPYLWHTSLGGR